MICSFCIRIAGDEQTKGTNKMIPNIEIVIPPAAQSTSNVPAFMAKLWQMVNDPRTDNIISWSPDGRSFIIHDQNTFSQTQLPYYYKHSNMSSFVRQLNMYDFHKVVGVESGGLKSEKQEEMEFQHQYFIKGMHGLLTQIKRKVSTSKSGQFLPNIKTEKVNEVLNEVSVIRDKQEDLDSKLNSMKTENEALWREVINLRQKHQKQQQIVNKLIHFLMSMVQPNMTPTVKRRYNNPLAIQGSSQSKMPKLETSPAATITANKFLNIDPASSNIQDITNEGKKRAAAAAATSSSGVSFSMDSLMATPSTTTTVVHVEEPTTPPVQQQQTSQSMLRSASPVAPAMRAVDPMTISPAISVAAASSSAASSSATAVPPTRPVLMRGLSREDLDLETTFTQREIDKLQDMIAGQVNIDPSLLTNLFNPEEPLSNLYAPPPATDKVAAAAAGGAPLRLQMVGSASAADNAVATVTPSLLELADIDDDAAGAAGGEAGSGAQTGLGSLDTPLVLADEIDPLLSQIKK